MSEPFGFEVSLINVRRIKLERESRFASLRVADNNANEATHARLY